MCICTLTRSHTDMPTHRVISEPFVLAQVHSADEPELCGKFNVCSKVWQEPAGIALDRFFYKRRRWLILALAVVEVALWLVHGNPDSDSKNRAWDALPVTISVFGAVVYLVFGVIWVGVMRVDALKQLLRCPIIYYYTSVITFARICYSLVFGDQIGSFAHWVVLCFAVSKM